MKIIRLFYIFIFLLFSCGLETYVFLEPVPNPNIVAFNSVTFYLPSRSSQPAEFRHYLIYYRIYLSDHTPAATPIASQIWQINSALAAHFDNLSVLTTNDIVSAALVMSEFNRYSYFQLHIENSTGDIDNIYSLLTTDGLVSIDFTPDNIGPFVSVNSGPNYPLIRPNMVNPRPQDNNSFFNNDVLSLELDQGINLDVHEHGNPNNSYVSMYIVAFGIDSNYSPIYSRATHIGIFLLP